MEKINFRSTLFFSALEDCLLYEDPNWIFQEASQRLHLWLRGLRSIADAVVNGW